MFSGLNALRALFLAALPALAGVGAHASQPPLDSVDFAAEPASDDARATARWVLHSHDNQGMPFVIVDKKRAKVFVFGPKGQILGAAPALLGLAPGDHSVPGIGERPVSQILPGERTTPAGRYVSEPGRNLAGEDVVWWDYDAGLAIHRVRPGSAQEQRQQRLASATPVDNRISLGCVVVAVPFYESVIAPVLGKRRGVIYVLPETLPVSAMFGATRQAGLPAGALR
ncbi:MAG: hypothetical protein EOP38_20385 [Rubrivivax sp.]|nr:MAG: hypothetical protein EOP38_20385 [Rubrivivax sp.]